MIEFERTRDLDRVREFIAGDAHVYAASTDDAAPARETFWPNGHPAIWYIIARDEIGDIGLFMLLPQNAATWEIHVTRVFGARAVEAGRAIVPWIFAHVPGCRRIVASIAATNRPAIRYAEACGLVRFGVNERSFLRGGDLIDQVLLGISAGSLTSRPMGLRTIGPTPGRSPTTRGKGVSSSANSHS